MLIFHFIFFFSILCSSIGPGSGTKFICLLDVIAMIYLKVKVHLTNPEMYPSFDIKKNNRIAIAGIIFTLAFFMSSTVIVYSPNLGFIYAWAIVVKGLVSIILPFRVIWTTSGMKSKIMLLFFKNVYTCEL